MDFNPYKILNVDQGAEPEFITNAYRFMSKKYHPDVNKTPEAAVRMRDINRAYEMLKDPVERRKIDDQLTREANTRTSASSHSSSYSNFNTSGSSRPSTPPPYTPNRRTYAQPSSARPSTAGSKPFDQFREWTQRWNKPTSAKPVPPSDRTLFLYKKSLVDDTSKKALRISVYYEPERSTKVCEVFSSAPDAKDKIISGAVYFHSEELFDFVTYLDEAIMNFEQSITPLEIQSDHIVYWRKTVKGLGDTFLGIEIIQRNRNNTKEALLLLGEKTESGAIQGVASPQTIKQIQQLSRIMSEALGQMRI